MFQEIKSVVIRSRETLCADALGAVLLMGTFVVGLYLPGLV